MAVRVHFIRAINVGGASLPMAELRSLATDLGAENVRTYIASGNLICSPPGIPEDFDRALERAIETHCGFFREVISRSVDEVREALAAHPFEIHNPKYSYVTFLSKSPTPEALDKAHTFTTGDDKWAVVGREMHIRYHNGAGRPQMKDASISRALGVPGTARNINTVSSVVELAKSVG
ncbi:DUF1697 domain-containing protein [Hoyosella rhizosphaerae]|uniref:DUF1697 domain-containing protein n=1 Tax=Hoyosella rhizosphaerae TaxID=1755582 RepID=A0A916U2S4_9ACTN|nr:DUF1697 domain-containing protein [Hoyosella rhizosphaerae]MBN4926653.1 DUF1697 domain-containing protein [Hoyosella rhizosphaerae]GGC57538.1 hypothetical protein GCM10011410_07550 [Hoyosella rhizosphaerae]